MPFSYLVYGLRIVSDRPIPGLTESLLPGIDLSLFLATGPDWLARARQLPLTQRLIRGGEDELHDPTFVLSTLGAEEMFRLDYSDGTHFVFDPAGQRLWGAYTPPFTLEDLVTYLLGPVLGFVLRRRGVSALHASGVEIAGCGVALVGPAASGKSTTAAALALRGCAVLCEDVCPLAEAGSEFFIEPGYPRICLWPDAVAKLFGAEDALPRLTPDWEKCYLPLDGERARFLERRIPLGTIYLLGERSPHDSAPSLLPLGPREALLELVQNTYMNYALDREHRAAEFDVLARLVRQIPVQRVVPHTDPERMPHLCDLLVRDAASIAARACSATPSACA